MSWPLKSLIAAGLLAAVGLVAVGMILGLEHGSYAQERRARETAIRPLVQSHATREQVVKSLGLEFVDYSVGSTNRQWLEHSFSHEQVRQGAERYPGVYFHTTAMTMTWLFFDAAGTLQDYYLCEQ